MQPFDPATFGDLNAFDYDETQDPGTTAETIQLIKEICKNGSLLELASGTGRIALPLAEAGFAVSGIEGSPDMVDIMRGKPGGADIPVVVGDMANVEIDGQFDHAILIFNTLFNLQSQNDQLRCFKNVAAKLPVGGTFWVEGFVPDFGGFYDGKKLGLKQMDRASVWIEAVEHDRNEQLLEFQRIRINEDGFKLVPFRMRYCWPGELDLMAKIAGMRLKHVWSDWNKSEFVKDSKARIAVYEKVES